jgi:hypothetical protein
MNRHAALRSMTQMGEHIGTWKMEPGEAMIRTPRLAPAVDDIHPDRKRIAQRTTMPLRACQDSIADRTSRRHQTDGSGAYGDLACTLSAR